MLQTYEHFQHPLQLDKLRPLPAYHVVHHVVRFSVQYQQLHHDQTVDLFLYLIVQAFLRYCQVHHQYFLKHFEHVILLHLLEYLYLQEKQRDYVGILLNQDHSIVDQRKEEQHQVNLQIVVPEDIVCFTR